MVDAWEHGLVLPSCRTHAQSSAFGHKSSCRDPDPSQCHAAPSNTAKLQTRAMNSVLSIDHRDKRWVLSPSCNTPVTLQLLQSAGEPVFYTTSLIPGHSVWQVADVQLTSVTQVPPTDSSVWYCDFLPGEKSSHTWSSGGEK